MTSTGYNRVEKITAIHQESTILHGMGPYVNSSVMNTSHYSNTTDDTRNGEETERQHYESNDKHSIRSVDP